jgi:chromosome segregation ATPase
MKRWLLPAVSVAVLLTGAGLFVASRRPMPATPVASASAQEQALRAELDRARQELEKLRAEADEPDTPDRPARPRSESPKVTDTATPELIRQLEETRRELEMARELSEGFRQKLEQADQRLAQLEEQQKKLTQAESGARAQVEALTDKVKELDAQRWAQQTRITDVENRNIELRKRQDDSGRKLAQLRQVAESLEDLSRRREGFLTAILQRYREATDLFRAMALRLDNMPDRSAAGSNDLARIQNAISLADEDMRQLRALNTRVTQLQKELRAMAP